MQASLVSSRKQIDGEKSVSDLSRRTGPKASSQGMRADLTSPTFMPSTWQFASQGQVTKKILEGVT